MSLYANDVRICGVTCALVMRGAVNGQYRAVFERELSSLEDIEGIDWTRPEVEGSTPLPEGYGFEVADIQYSPTTRSYTVLLQVGRQYLGDVTGYQEQIEALTETVADREAALAEKDRALREQEQAAQALEAELAAAYVEGVESNG